MRNRVWTWPCREQWSRSGRPHCLWVTGFSGRRGDATVVVIIVDPDADVSRHTAGRQVRTVRIGDGSVEGRQNLGAQVHIRLVEHPVNDRIGGLLDGRIDGFRNERDRGFPDERESERRCYLVGELRGRPGRVMIARSQSIVGSGDEVSAVGDAWAGERPGMGGTRSASGYDT